MVGMSEPEVGEIRVVGHPVRRAEVWDGTEWVYLGSDASEPKQPSIAELVARIEMLERRVRYLGRNAGEERL